MSPLETPALARPQVRRAFAYANRAGRLRTIHGPHFSPHPGSRRDGSPLETPALARPQRGRAFACANRAGRSKGRDRPFVASPPRPSPAHEGRRANGSGPGTDRPRCFLRPVRSQSAGAGWFSGSAGKRPAGRMGPLRADSGAFLVTLLAAKESRTAGFVIAPQGAERFSTDGKKGDKRPFSEVSFIEKEMFSSHPRCPS